ncbi:dihydropteroate synthase [Thiomicrorhabdus arctica]|uniref:dihydropteroate synthase n=1 Tax=Thiomicrorhabdus arctica TaxID=131540 RepID=UPI000361F271|nr:dihydropteroate synthase [Thiomicrorhabdus arctica]
MFNIKALIDEKSSTQDGMPLVMGVLNVTPDSFSDGGRFVTQNQFTQHVAEMVLAGVDIIDVGGESTRPGAIKIGLQQELDRVLPAIEWIAARYDTPLSIDTYKPQVMSEAVSGGAVLINDVNALQAEGAIECAINSGATVCLMHKLGEFATMQDTPEYQDVVKDVCDFLLARANLCQQAGMDKNKIILDPGFGFGKTLAHNSELFENLERFVLLGYPLLVGVSRKRMIGDILNAAAVEDRIVGSVAAAVLASLKGARIVRVHDVKETVEALRVTMHLM